MCAGVSARHIQSGPKNKNLQTTCICSFGYINIYPKSLTTKYKAMLWFICFWFSLLLFFDFYSLSPAKRLFEIGENNHATISGNFQRVSYTCPRYEKSRWGKFIYLFIYVPLFFYKDQ